LVDPLLSSGFPLTLLGIARLSQLFKQDWESKEFGDALDDYSRQTFRELDATAALVGALYLRMKDFDVFTELTLLYFAAASFAETARRLGKTDLASSFLLADDKRFRAGFDQCLELARGPLHGAARTAFTKLVGESIAPVNVAGLANPQRRHWYPALAEDLLAAAPKLGVDEGTIGALLARCGFFKQ
jgi:FADH2 O2-dependent halogenase